MARATSASSSGSPSERHQAPGSMAGPDPLVLRGPPEGLPEGSEWDASKAGGSSIRGGR